MLRRYHFRVLIGLVVGCLCGCAEKHTTQSPVPPPEHKQPLRHQPVENSITRPDGTHNLLAQAEVTAFRGILSRTSPWKSPSHQPPPPKLPGFEHRIHLTENISGISPPSSVYGIAKDGSLIFNEQERSVLVVNELDRIRLANMVGVPQ